MEKLLHERLREWAKHDSERSLYPVIKAAREFGIKNTGAAEERELFEKFAAEIERYYIPRPRFENGEPIQWDDEFVAGGRDSFLTSICYGMGGDVFLNNLAANKKSSLHITDGEFVKRPALKVYDADGVETKAGDEGFDVKTGCEMTVLFVQPDDDEYALFVRCKDGTEIHLQADQFTHERPVFDAEGVRICKGDTVRTVHTASKFTVHGFTDDGAVIVRFGKDADDLTTYAPHGLVHREPDSPERIIHDICEYCKLGSTDTCDAAEFIAKIADRAAIIERCA